MGFSDVKSNPELNDLIFNGGWIKDVYHFINIKHLQDKITLIDPQPQPKSFTESGGFGSQAIFFYLKIVSADLSKENKIECRLFLDSLTYEGTQNLDRAGGFESNSFTFETKVKLRILRIIFEQYEYFKDNPCQSALIWTCNTYSGAIGRQINE